MSSAIVDRAHPTETSMAIVARSQKSLGEHSMWMTAVPGLSASYTTARL